MTPQGASRLASVLLVVGCLALVAFTAHIGYLIITVTP